MQKWTSLILAAVLVIVPAAASTREVRPDDVPTGALVIASVEQIDTAIAASVAEWPRHRMLRHPEERRAMAEAISDATIYTDVSPILLVAVVKRESSFDEKALGKLGEKGLTQMKGVAARGCDLDSIDGQLGCSVRLLTMTHNRCGTWSGALTVYATRAGTCTSEHPNVKAAVMRRLRDWQRWSMAVLKREEEATAAMAARRTRPFVAIYAQRGWDYAGGRTLMPGSSL